MVLATEKLNKTQVFIFLGRAGCGKGTQAKLLVDKFNLAYIGSGEMLRSLSRQPGFTGQKTAAVMNSGDLVPTFLIFRLWVNFLEETKINQNQDFSGLVFDGSPRKLVEAQMLEEALRWYEWDKNLKVLLVDISREEAFSRLTKRRQCKNCGQLIPFVGYYKILEKCDKCGGELIERVDDAPEAINLRLDLFEQEVKPVIDYFDKKGLLVKINGEQPIENVHQEILSKIGK